MKKEVLCGTILEIQIFLSAHSSSLDAIIRAQYITTLAAATRIKIIAIMTILAILETDSFLRNTQLQKHNILTGYILLYALEGQTYSFHRNSQKNFLLYTLLFQQSIIDDFRYIPLIFSEKCRILKKAEV